MATTDCNVYLYKVSNSAYKNYLENKNYDIKIDDVKYEANATTRILTVQLEAGSHELAKASTSNLFYIELIPVAE